MRAEPAPVLRTPVMSMSGSGSGAELETAANAALFAVAALAASAMSAPLSPPHPARLKTIATATTAAMPVLRQHDSSIMIFCSFPIGIEIYFVILNYRLLRPGL
ncbi:hypothetical protein BN2476_720064 [Paraburkholderia piptadeniae]|uniref:Uncharacterized protein n=1 Tax=Paraburkholderia piptadeniae TaxID=1701573 RepID=A0A1N7SR09_9BURK|nr:hypothetical protein BN2476_720064 [Paraburkholderia piptadeniae]